MNDHDRSVTDMIKRRNTSCLQFLIERFQVNNYQTCLAKTLDL